MGMEIEKAIEVIEYFILKSGLSVLIEAWNIIKERLVENGKEN